MRKSRLLGIVCAGLLALIVSTPSSATLTGRLETTPGSGLFQAYYDDVLNITWLTDASLPDSETFGVSGFVLNGSSWNTAQSWITAMNADGGTGYLGTNNWRLPSMGADDDNPRIDCSAASEIICRENEYGYMFYYNNITAANNGMFSNILSNGYWSGSQYDSGNSWHFNFGNGGQLQAANGITNAVWPVVDGDVFASTVPIPPALWLFGTGLLGLIGMGRRRVS